MPVWSINAVSPRFVRFIRKSYEIRYWKDDIQIRHVDILREIDSADIYSNQDVFCILLAYFFWLLCVICKYGYYYRYRYYYCLLAIIILPGPNESLLRKWGNTFVPMLFSIKGLYWSLIISVSSGTWSTYWLVKQSWTHSECTYGTE